MRALMDHHRLGASIIGEHDPAGMKGWLAACNFVDGISLAELVPARGVDEPLG
jgi:hypothetical protein